MAKSREPQADVGLIGLAVMGSNLALNMADHGFRVAVLQPDRPTYGAIPWPTTPTRRAAWSAARPWRNWCAALRRPRSIVLMIKAGAPVDAVIGSLLPLLDRGDVIVDGGNSLWTDTIRRERELAQHRIHFVGSGVSGGEEGARFGPVADARRQPRGLERIEADLDRDRGQGGPQDGPAAGGRGAGQAGRGGRALRRPHRHRRRRPLREDGAQRDRVRRHAVDLRGLLPAEPAARAEAAEAVARSSPAGTAATWIRS